MKKNEVYYEKLRAFYLTKLLKTSSPLLKIEKSEFRGELSPLKLNNSKQLNKHWTFSSLICITYQWFSSWNLLFLIWRYLAFVSNADFYERIKKFSSSMFSRFFYFPLSPFSVFYFVFPQTRSKVMILRKHFTSEILEFSRNNKKNDGKLCINRVVTRKESEKVFAEIRRDLSFSWWRENFLI